MMRITLRFEGVFDAELNIMRSYIEHLIVAINGYVAYNVSTIISTFHRDNLKLVIKYAGQMIEI